MKQTIFTFLFFTAIVLVSCRKDKYNPNIAQYDDDQITAYIKANGLTGMVRDTSGIYYKIITPGTGSVIQYTDSISMVYTLSSFDRKYISADTIINHFEDFTGHIAAKGYPYGLQFAIHNILNHTGGIMRLLIPSHLAYGVSGTGSGSSSVNNSRISGNQCLDYYIHIIASQEDAAKTNNQDVYDQRVIKNYIAANGLSSSMKQDPSGIWYSISTPGTGTVAITDSSTVTATFTVALFNLTIASQYNISGGASIDIPDLIPGMQTALKKYATAGTLMTVLIPSSLAYGKSAQSPIPSNSCVRYDIQIVGVSP
jgi:FKBP-type peptidyl-prolyl cis-trans isomerase FkpA